MAMEKPTVQWSNRGTPPKKAFAEDMKGCYEVADKSSGVTLVVRTGRVRRWSQNKIEFAMPGTRQISLSLASIEALKLSRDARLTRVSCYKFTEYQI